MAGDAKEFAFVDESGDPGPVGNATYILVCAQMPESVLDSVRLHIARFRYFHEVNRELKEWGGLLKDTPTAQWRSLLEPFCKLTEANAICASVNWLNKEKYKAGGGPYLAPGESQKFRSFQLRLLLERHKARHGWGDNMDVVIDRWSMDQAQRQNLEKYLKGNWKLQPVAHITTADSAYVDMIQIIDLYARLARKVVLGEATDEQHEYAANLFDLVEIVKGRY
ncbi:MAG TPA: DUF3800 domain-containing protein [Actinomycetota bacterium]|jgi:hypothetical protein|nr:DUF3800 domain-containing protein [Actinomycetota bacterium]